MTWILGNLTCEADWAGVALPHRVRQHLSAAATLLRVFAEEGDVLWTPEPVDPRRLPILPELPRPELRSGPIDPARQPTLAWSRCDALTARLNNRAFGLELAQKMGCALPGARMVRSVETLEGPWVLKPPLSAAGRGQLRGSGPPDSALARRIGSALATYGELLLEPWLDRIADYGQCGPEPHQLLVEPNGAFRGIRPARGNAPAELTRTYVAVVRALAEQGYDGPVGIDAFLHRDGFHPLCEINARMSFGRVARALGDRLGLSGPMVTLRFGRRQPPDGSVPLILPGPPDGLAAWISQEAQDH